MIFHQAVRSVLAPRRGAIAELLPSLRDVSKSVITSYSELGIEQTQWSWKEDSKRFNFLSCSSPNASCTRSYGRLKLTQNLRNLKNDLNAFLLGSSWNLSMARQKVPRNKPPRKRAWGIVINGGVAPSHTTHAKLPKKGGKAMEKGLLIQLLLRRALIVWESMQPISLFQSRKVRTIEQVPSVPPVQVPPPRSLNRLKAAGLRTILEEKRLSTDGVVDKYLDVWNTIKFHKFESFTKP
ncbi:hypothetical protein MTR67_035688 [Solanum verrucosum]|uniref:Uncharacterized protein n=1 Tax=Solanum verrucosum TaxID=315347 RepID=A0AAF0ZLQ4_SOLVR|nr:hypothetical protein MTR67_035688 [Solanum verrucosum]